MADESDKAGRHRAVRQFCRMIASTLIAATAQADVSLTEIAARLGLHEKDVRKMVNRLMDGESKGVSMDHVSGLFFACNGATLKFDLERADA